MISDDHLDMVDTTRLVDALKRRSRSFVIGIIRQGDHPANVQVVIAVGGDAGAVEVMGLGHMLLTRCQGHLVAWQGRAESDEREI